MIKDTLYHQDFTKWVKVTVEQLKQKEWFIPNPEDNRR